MNSRIGALVVAGLWVAAGAAWAHHNMSALFDFNNLSAFPTDSTLRQAHRERYTDPTRLAACCGKGALKQWGLNRAVAYNFAR